MAEVAIYSYAESAYSGKHSDVTAFSLHDYDRKGERMRKNGKKEWSEMRGMGSRIHK
jgi:hypothetical protein